MIYDVNGTPTGIAYYDTVEAMKAAAADRGVTKRDIYQALLSEADEA